MTDRTASLDHYTNTLRWGLAYLDGKNPDVMGPGWHKRPITKPGDFPEGYNIGLNHEYSRTATLDIDHPAAKLAFEIVGISLESLLEEAPYKIVGNPDNYPKPVFRIPEGTKLKVKQLKWPDPSGKVNGNGTPHLITIFELRGGDGASQDVLPPSVHPDTGTAYTWLNDNIPQSSDDIPFLPQKLLMLWENWDTLNEKLKKSCPWAEKKQPQAGSDFHVAIVQKKFNEKYMPVEVLERNGYKPKGKKWLCPNSSSGIPGIIVLGEGEKIVSFHGSDPLGDGYPHDAYDCAVILEYGGDRKKAWHELKKELGITFDHSTNGNGNGNGNGSSAHNGEEFSEGEQADEEPATSPVFKPFTLAELMQQPPKEWLIDNLIGRGDITMVFGDAGSGKTFIAIDLILAAALGRQFAARFPIKQPLRVAYCAGEGIAGLPNRFAAAINKWHVSPNDLALTIYTDVPQLFDDQAEKSIYTFVRELSERSEQIN